jgi:hypothetical protein
MKPFITCGEGLFGPSMGQTPPRKRGGTSLRLSKFVPDKFVEPLGFSSDLSPPDTQKALALMKVFVAGRGIVRPVHGPNPSAQARRGQPAAVQIRSRRICRTVRVLIKTSLSARYAKSAHWALFAYLAEREGFEPSIRLLTLYSLSRGAPSASRASLRVLFPRRRGAGKDTGQSPQGKGAINDRRTPPKHHHRFRFRL